MSTHVQQRDHLLTLPCSKVVTCLHSSSTERELRVTWLRLGEGWREGGRVERGRVERGREGGMEGDRRREGDKEEGKGTEELEN